MDSPQTANMFSAACITRYALVEIADKWTILVVAALSERSYYFGELRRKIGGISQKMLTQTLRRLEADGIVKRQVQQGSVIRVSYSLTPVGESLVGPLRALQDWVIDNAGRLHRQLDEACV